MTAISSDAENVERLVESSDLAGALESERFKRFLDHVPIAIAISELSAPEKIIYVNSTFEAVTGLSSADLKNKYWDVLSGEPIDDPEGASLVSVIVDHSNHVACVRINGSSHPIEAELHSNLIEDDTGAPTYRLVALVDAAPGDGEAQSLKARIQEKDTLLRELQHRVKNNLQMITALIRLEMRHADTHDQGSFTRLAGRVASLAMLYDTLSLSEESTEVDLGVYLSQIATAVMASHAVEGIRLDLRVDAHPVSVNVAMPTGLVVNELLTNSLKHAFRGRDGGTIKLHSLVEGDGCTIIVADDGVGLPAGVTWPQPGRMGALIADSLRQNANADFEVTSDPATGTVVTISFNRSAAVERAH